MTKTHRIDDPGWTLNRRRDGTHIGACAEGYLPGSSKFHQVHHVLPLSSLSDSTIRTELNDSAKFTVLRRCLKVTDWNANAAGNCVGLPLKRAFHDQGAPAGWDGWPCHLVDHNPDYTDEVSHDLKSRVWNKTLKDAKNCEFDPETLAARLEEASVFWLEQLLTRGWREGGTKICWQKRNSIPKTWFMPFSMAAVPRKRSAPADWAHLSKNVQAYLDKLFAAIK